MTVNQRPHRSLAPVVPDSVEDTQDIDTRAVLDAAVDSLIVAGDGWGRDGGDSVMAIEWPGGFLPTADDIQIRRAWVSAPATSGLIISVVGLCAVLTGLLAPEGFVLGVIGLVLCIGGLITAGRPGMTGQGVATIGIACGSAAIALAIVAMSGRYEWLSSGTSAIEHWHSWLVGHWPWLGRWS